MTQRVKRKDRKKQQLKMSNYYKQLNEDIDKLAKQLQAMFSNNEEV